MACSGPSCCCCCWCLLPPSVAVAELRLLLAVSWLADAFNLQQQRQGQHQQTFISRALPHKCQQHHELLHAQISMRATSQIDTGQRGARGGVLCAHLPNCCCSSSSSMLVHTAASMSASSPAAAASPSACWPAAASPSWLSQSEASPA